MPVVRTRARSTSYEAAARRARRQQGCAAAAAGGATVAAAPEPEASVAGTGRSSTAARPLTPTCAVVACFRPGNPAAPLRVWGGSVAVASAPLSGCAAVGLGPQRACWVGTKSVRRMSPCGEGNQEAGHESGGHRRRPKGAGHWGGWAGALIYAARLAAVGSGRDGGRRGQRRRRKRRALTARSQK